MKENIKRFLSKNTYINANVYKTLSAKSLSEMKSLCAEASEDDSIRDVSWLKQLRKDVAEGKRGFYTTDCNFSNSHIYGIWNSLFGDMKEEPVFTPSVEHGLIFHDQIFNDLEDTARASFVTFGSFRKEIIRKYSKIPVFCVGPYIHYAKPFYTESQFLEEKKRNGKTLLVFPMHSTNNGKLVVEIENYLSYLRKKRSEYDTVLINSFWWNINDPLTEALASEGYRIVSAGFRDDVMFMSRLKTLIMLSDLVVGDSIGTHVGYCIDCGVPFSFEPLGSYQELLLEKEKKDLDFCKSHMSIIEKAFFEADRITPEQRKICDYYWGTNCLKTSMELATMISFSRALVKKTKGWKKKYSTAAESILEELPDFRNMLQEAIQ